MRIALFIGLLYLAYSINPEYMTRIESLVYDRILVSIVVVTCLVGDWKEILKQKSNG